RYDSTTLICTIHTAASSTIATPTTSVRTRTATRPYERKTLILAVAADTAFTRDSVVIRATLGRIATTAKKKICRSLTHQWVSENEISTMPAANGAEVPDWITPRAIPVAMIPKRCSTFSVIGASTDSSLDSAGARRPITVMTSPITPSATIDRKSTRLNSSHV